MSNDNTPTGGDGGRPGRDATGVACDAVTGDELDELLAALADEDRRRVLDYLEAADGDVAAFSDLVEHLTGDPRADPEQVAVTLHHTHLPKLESANVVEYDPRSETVRYRGGPAVAEWLALVRSHEPDRRT
jgi:DNA-binding transcriptional ArsR family regulator